MRHAGRRWQASPGVGESRLGREAVPTASTILRCDEEVGERGYAALEFEFVGGLLAAGGRAVPAALAAACGRATGPAFDAADCTPPFTNRERTGGDDAGRAGPHPYHR